MFHPFPSALGYSEAVSDSGQIPTTADSQKESIWSAPYIALMAVNFFQSMAAFMANTTLPVYLDALGATTSIVGVVVGAFAITALLIRPFAGPAFDSFSRKRMLLGTQAIIVVSLIGYSVVGSVPGLFLVRLLHGIGIGCGGPLAMTFVSEFLPSSRLALGISIYALAQSVAQVIGPAVGLWMVDVVGFSFAYLIAAGSVLIAMGGVLLCKEKPRERLPYKLAPSRMFAREAMPKAVALMLLAIAFAATTSYLVLYGNLLGVEGMGAYFSVYALCLVATRPIFGKAADRFGAQRVLPVGVALFAVSYIMLWQVRDFAGFMAVAVVASCGFGACAPLIQSMALESVPPERRGAASNTAFTGLDFGMLIGPATAGFVIEALVPAMGGITEAYSAMWLVMIAPLVIAMAIILSWNRKR